MNQTTDSVRIVIFDNNFNHFLVLSEKDDPENLKLPGGKFENEMESATQAAWRELSEELGLSEHQINLSMADELINDDGVSRRFVYFGNCQEKFIRPSDEIAKTIWSTEENIPECKNRHHILAAVACCRKIINKK